MPERAEGRKWKNKNLYFKPDLDFTREHRPGRLYRQCCRANAPKAQEVKMNKYEGKEERINGKWYAVTVEAETVKTARKKLYIGQRKSYGTVEAIRGRFSKIEGI